MIMTLRKDFAELDKHNLLAWLAIRIDLAHRVQKLAVHPAIKITLRCPLSLATSQAKLRRRA
jgi:hypothetical protein